MARKPQETEASIQRRIREALVRAGWTLSEKTHGNKYQSGWPDLVIFHPHRGVRFVEVKKPSRKGQKNCFEPSQVARFSMWTGAGLDVYVLSDTDFSILNGKGNWTEWLDSHLAARFELRRQALCPDGPKATRLEEWT